MAEYIKREAVLRAVQGQRSPCRSPAQNRMLDCLKAAVIRISAADVVQVLRCKDCKDWGPGTGDVPICWETYEPMPPDGFCSCGERKDGGDG